MFAREEAAEVAEAVPPCTAGEANLTHAATDRRASVSAVAGLQLVGRSLCGPSPRRSSFSAPSPTSGRRASLSEPTASPSPREEFLRRYQAANGRLPTSGERRHSDGAIRCQPRHRCTPPPPLPNLLQLDAADRSAVSLLMSVDFPDEVLALICSFLTARDLCRLARVARRFSEPMFSATSSQKSPPSSPIECGARIAVARRRSWTSMPTLDDPRSGIGAAPAAPDVFRRELREIERAQTNCCFAECGPSVIISDSGGVATFAEHSGIGFAVCGLVLTGGIHYAEFCLEKGGYQMAWFGVVGADATENDAVSQLVAGAKVSQQAHNLPRSWMCRTYNSELWQNGRHLKDWSGVLEQRPAVKEGDTVGLELNFDAQTLILHINGQCRGPIVRPGMRFRDGRLVAPLLPPLQWAVDVGRGASLRVTGGHAPPRKAS